MTFAPIVLFVYARFIHTRLTVEALLENPEAEFSDLIIFSDATRTPEKQANVDEVRAYLKTINGFRSITIHHRPHNFGLAKSIIEGVTEVLKRHERIIVLEDDLVTSPYFLKFMNEALDKYMDDDRVASIHGYVYPIKQSLPEAFFLRGADCWGWATWRRGWKLFNPNGQYLLDELVKRRLIREFNFNGAYPFSSMLEGQIKGCNDSWAIRWHAAAFLADKLTLYPGRSLVKNIGFDGGGTHCNKTTTWDVQLSPQPIYLDNVSVKHCQLGWVAFQKFFNESKAGLITRIIMKLKEKENIKGFIKYLKVLYLRQQYQPGYLGIFINPLYLARVGLNNAMIYFAPSLSGRLLDIGCGKQPYRKYFKVDVYIGLEIDNEKSRDRGIADQFYDGNIFPFPNASFDSALCNQVLEHVFNPDEFLSEIARVLKPGGKLLLTVPFVWDEHEQPYDYARYSSFGLRALLEKQGLKIINQKKLASDASIIFQLTNAYLFKITQHLPNRMKILFTATVIAFFNLLGILAAKILPDNPDLFLDHVVLVEKTLESV